MDINKAIQICHKNRVYVYPIKKLGKWYIHREYNGKDFTYEKPIDVKDQSKAMSATYINLANKL